MGSVADAEEVIDTYMFLFITGRRERDRLQSYYPNWPETQKFAHGVLSEISAEFDSSSGSLTFDAVTRTVEEIGERYGRWQNAECQEFKGALMKLEEAGNGRVLLKEFYGKRIDGSAFQFTESVEYLRDLGALDEHDPENMRVIIPNYVHSPSNCIASSSIYSICCLSECESLLGHLERDIGGPDAEATYIA